MDTTGLYRANRAEHTACSADAAECWRIASGDAWQYALYYGLARGPLARIVPDACWAGMWRIAWPDGQLSDMTNLDRAKDAAAAIAERGPPRRDQRRLHWKRDRWKTGSEGLPVASIEKAGLRVRERPPAVSWRAHLTPGHRGSQKDTGVPEDA